jgi:hypothetical protein
MEKSTRPDCLDCLGAALLAGQVVWQCTVKEREICSVFARWSRLANYGLSMHGLVPKKPFLLSLSLSLSLCVCVCVCQSERAGERERERERERETD